jgi:hypothetical protein
VGKIAGDLDEQPLEVVGGEEEVRGGVTGEEGCRSPLLQLISGRRCSRSHRRPLRRRRHQLCRERGERKSYRCRVSFRCVAWDGIQDLGLEFLNPGRTRCFGGDIGQGSIPPEFNRTGCKLGPGLNPGESDPGCQMGIRARSRPGWDETNKP